MKGFVAGVEVVVDVKDVKDVKDTFHKILRRVKRGTRWSRDNSKDCCRWPI